jgi:hypothetical protein
MAMQLPADFKEFLSLLGLHGVRYLLIGGYAVNYYGYTRATGDIDVWIALDAENAERMVKVGREFGFDTPELSPELFMQEGRIVRMGNIPLRIDILTVISGVTFEECYGERIWTTCADSFPWYAPKRHTRSTKQPDHFIREKRGVQRDRQKPEEQRKIGCPLLLWPFSVPL